jgi:hypothetical protein
MTLLDNLLGAVMAPVESLAPTTSYSTRLAELTV